MAFFGLGKSKKDSDKVADGIVHDTKQADTPSQDILDEFEAQFSDGSAPVSAPEERVPKTVHSAAPETPSDDPFSDLFSVPSDGGGMTDAPSPHAPASESSIPDNYEDPFAPPNQAVRSQAPQPTQQASVPVAEPKPPEPIRTETPKPAPSEQNGPIRFGSAPEPLEASGTPPQEHEDLPDFDFDFHPTDRMPEAPEASPSRQTVAQPAPAEPETPPPTPTRSNRASLDLPSFETNDAFENAAPKPRTWDDLTAPAGTRPWQRAPAQPSTSASEPEKQAPKRPSFGPLRFGGQPEPKESEPTAITEQVSTASESQGPVHIGEQPPAPRPAHEPARTEPPKQEDVVMRNGELFIEKISLIRHLRDLDDLRGLSKETHAQFERVDKLAGNEKKLLDKVQKAISEIHDTLERSDTLLFTSEQQ